ncbi:MAG: isoleucine--tRNA ligase, partial [Elusimicrobia bacterium]|nr:isoleucine--tRNA ligase [Elusimicrobiota bacterium]
VPGWDCHGLPIEIQLMKERGWTKNKVGRVPFRQEAARFAERFVGIQKQEFKRLGILGDWEHPYKTLTPDYEASIAETFFALFEKGFITRDKKPVYWCAADETALAEAEVEYEDRTDASVFVKFPVLEWPNNEDAQKLAKAVGKKASVLVWTTTPWTLPANVALAFHPEQTYRIWEMPDKEKVLVGEPGWKVLEGLQKEERKASLTIEGLSLEGLLCKNPLNNNESQGVLAEFVSREEGTGVVHIAPGHGEEDYAVGREYGLAVLSPVDDSGRFTQDVLPISLAGKTVWEANPIIVEMLSKTHQLVKETKISHSYPHCWRCKNPVLFRATEQWFLRVSDDFRQSLIRLTDDVRWTPEYGKERILGMLKVRPAWCLSRQRYWGTPIPMFLCDGCREPVRDQNVFAHIVDLFRKNGSNVWFEEEAEGLVPPGTKCPKCGKTSFRKENDILDVWFDSGVSWMAVLRKRLGVEKRDSVMYLEGSDQHRGWFQTSLLPAAALTKEPPYKEVLTHGFVVDGEGRKMSKSLGNVIAPQEVLEKYGADILRLWVSMSDYREDVRLSQNILDRVIDTYRKIRNTLRFLLGNLADFDPAQHGVPFEKMREIDLGALAHLDLLIREVEKRYDSYEFHLVSDKICNDFCINLLSAYYLDVQKDILYCDKADSLRRRSAQTAFLIITTALAKMLAPLLSFTAEETWQALREQNLLDPNSGDNLESVFLNPFLHAFPFPDLNRHAERMAGLTRLKEAINLEVEKKRQAGEIKGANDACVSMAGNSSLLDLSADDLRSYMGVGKVDVERSGAEPLAVTSVGKAPGAKCNRCWIWREDVNPEGLCVRCADAEKETVAASS